ncbi:unnamed protein product [Nesidiocoris tenuis]|uniref:C2HC/C3H-type domain-containing protein n=1 Tax=Nesidiocoris tenuis TaxID=355587 RepID=A0A6H5GQG6_9HEMI|nr:unnamed protein product [Nesidiocoris tenuis]
MSHPGKRGGNLHEVTSTELNRTPCAVCKRKFPEDRLRIHENICKTARRKRPQYNAVERRLNGVATEDEIRRIMRNKDKPVRLSEIPWRESHLTWSHGGNPKRKIPVSRSQSAFSQVSAAAKDDGRMQCPGCHRRFAPDVAEKHIPGCIDRNRTH